MKSIKILQCDGCGVQFSRGSSNRLCKICRGYGKRSKGYKLVKDVTITSQMKSNISILLVKFKYGLWKPIDMFRVVDLYLQIYEYEVFFETLNELDQVKIMLRRMKDLLCF
jgi:hypothetical protein